MSHVFSDRDYGLIQQVMWSQYLLPSPCVMQYDCSRHHVSGHRFRQIHQKHHTFLLSTFQMSGCCGLTCLCRRASGWLCSWSPAGCCGSGRTECGSCCRWTGTDGGLCSWALRAAAGSLHRRVGRRRRTRPAAVQTPAADAAWRTSRDTADRSPCSSGLPEQRSAFIPMLIKHSRLGHSYSEKHWKSSISHNFKSHSNPIFLVGFSLKFNYSLHVCLKNYLMAMYCKKTKRRIFFRQVKTIVLFSEKASQN